MCHERRAVVGLKADGNVARVFPLRVINAVHHLNKTVDPSLAMDSLKQQPSHHSADQRDGVLG